MEQSETKKIKDPIYGYVSIPSQYMKDIIDTSVFQRLRRVIQTSYTPLYSSVLHNRFVHSLGVLHLGRIVAERLTDVIIKNNYLDDNIAWKYGATYQIACLLHDIGHAPFSHTGEIYYRNDNFSVIDLHKRLCELVSSEEFIKDLPLENESAAPHEIMSAIFGISEFGSIIGDDECKELFARCITGYLYKRKTSANEIKNCFIGMLNSKVIDVDRLDYLIRDAYTSGFATITIDYMRLLNALTIIKYNGQYEIAYKKDAVSVIENVVYAHDAERKWIQNYPVVLYEAYIIKHILEHLNKKMNRKNHKLFSEKSLSKKGHKLEKDIKVSLMCDDDIIYLSKNVFSDALSEEFFDRNKRRHLVWKSEAEYMAYIGNISTGGEITERFIECMQSFNESKIPDHPIPMIINDDLVKKFNKELKNAKKERKQNAYDDNQIKAIERKLAVCRYLKNYVEERKLPFDFIIIQTSMFNSNFSKKHLGKVRVAFGEGTDVKVKNLKEVCNLLKSDMDDKDFYYLFYRRKEPNESESGKIDDIGQFCSGLYDAATK